MSEERTSSTKKGLRAEMLVRRAVGGSKGACDVHTHLGGYEVRWGRGTKNGPGLAHDRTRAARYDGYCVQVVGEVSNGDRSHGDRSLVEFLRDHGYPPAAAITKAAEIRIESTDETIPISDVFDGQLEIGEEEDDG
jgi:hypothetical protein